MPLHREKVGIFALVAIAVIALALFNRISGTINDKQVTTKVDVNGSGNLNPAQEFFSNQKSSDGSATGSVGSGASVAKPSAPSVTFTAKAYLVGNIKTGKIYLMKNRDEQLPVASMSKLVTAVVATDSMSSTSAITISAGEASAPPDTSGIHEGETYTLAELLYPMLLNSSNIAAEAIASSSDRVKFIESMSSYAWEIGMREAYFADPSGVNPHNMATADGIFSLAKYLYDYRPDILALTRTIGLSVATTSTHDSHDFRSIHPFVTDPRFIGGKTGRTPEAGETMLTILDIGGEPVAFVVMGSSYGYRENDTRVLLSRFESQMRI